MGPKTLSVKGYEGAAIFSSKRKGEAAILLHKKMTGLFSELKISHLVPSCRTISFGPSLRYVLEIVDGEKEGIITLISKTAYYILEAAPGPWKQCFLTPASTFLENRVSQTFLVDNSNGPQFYIEILFLGLAVP